MMTIDRTKYMDATEVAKLRTVTEAACIVDLAKGRIRGVLTWMVVDTAILTGLRVSELARLKIGDADLKRGALRVTRSKKAKPRPESLAIAPDLMDHLRDYIAWMNDVGYPVGKADALFVGKRGALTVQGLQQIWRAAVKAAGLPIELSIHSARHTIATAMLKKTGNLRAVQKQLGHSSPATTANMYADISFEDMQAATTGLYA